MSIDLEALKKKWAPAIERVRAEFAAEGDARIELRTLAVALDAELKEAVESNDFARALPVMAVLEETNRAIDAMNLVGIGSVLSGLELVRGIKSDPGGN